MSVMTMSRKLEGEGTGGVGEAGGVGGAGGAGGGILGVGLGMGSRPAVLPIKLTPSRLRPVAYRILSKKHGLNLKSSGLDTLADFMGRKFGEDWRRAKGERFLDDIGRAWKEQDRGLFLDGEALEVVIREVYDNTGKNDSISRRTSTLSLAQSKESSKTVQDSPTQDPLDSQENGTLTKQNSLSKLDWKDYFSVIDCGNLPHYKYNHLRKNFELRASAGKLGLLGGAAARTSLFADRYHIVHDRLFRHEAFQAPSFRGSIGSSMSNSLFHTVTLIKNMLGRDGNSFLLFGLLTKGGNGKWWLQDTSGKIELDIETHALPAEGSYYTAGCLVLCDGNYEKEMFIVSTLGPPPAERRTVSQKAYGNLDFLGIHSTNASSSIISRIDPALESQMKLHEKEFTDHKIIILGANLFLDKSPTLNGLRKVFLKLEAEAQEAYQAPIAIIMPGSFVSCAFHPEGSSSSYKESFNSLSKLLSEFKLLAAETKFIFLPGDNDPWGSSSSSGASAVWPCKPIPNIFTNRVRRVVPLASWSSNPSRLAYLSQEIVICRDDIGARFRRNSVIFPEQLRRQLRQQDAQGEAHDQNHITLAGDDDSRANEAALRAIEKLAIEKAGNTTVEPLIKPDVAEARKLVRTILDQGHLSPFPLSTRPVYWQYDHALTLSPLPSVVSKNGNMIFYNY